MIRFRLAAAMLIIAGTALWGAAEAQTAPATGAGQRATHRLLRPSTARPSHRSPDFHRRAHGTVTHATPIHRTMAGPRV
jgi:hypothetical protein